MPRFSLRKQNLKALDAFIISQTALLAHDHATIPLFAPAFIPNLMCCIILMCSSLHDRDEDSDDGAEHQEQMLMFAFVILLLTTMHQQSHLANRKRKLDEDEASLAMLILARQQAHKARYILPRIRRTRLELKEETFNRWFQETDRTWLTVVSWPGYLSHQFMSNWLLMRMMIDPLLIEPVCATV